MNDTDLWNEAENCTNEDNNTDIQNIGWELFNLYENAYNWDNSNPKLNSIIEYNISLARFGLNPFACKSFKLVTKGGCTKAKQLGENNQTRC